jgi:hypothetical protein
MSKEKTKMRNKVEIDGKWYELVPLEEKKESSPDPVFYYGCDSECGIFRFKILLNDVSSFWKGTGSLEYYSKGINNKDDVEIWDNVDFLNDVLDNPTDTLVIEVKEIIKHNSGEFEDLVHLLKQVREKGWI